MKSRDGSRITVIATLLCLAMLVALSWDKGADKDALVVYCSHDSTYSEQILREFERDSGIRVIARFDTEATKSIGLINLLIAEREYPQCDVFWNNEVLGTMKLNQLGLLQAYQGDGYSRIPDAFKARDGSWVGFAARMRVFIVNSDQMEPAEEAIKERLAAKDLSRVAIARPLFGTTLTQYTVSWDEAGAERLKQLHRDQRDCGLLEVNGNSVVKDLVANGQCDFGWTDTDDYFLAVDGQKPVDMIPVRTDSGKTICIPNSVGIIRGTRRLKAAQQLVDYLLSEKVELQLARSPSRQIPLGRVDVDALPEEVQQLMAWAEDAVDLACLDSSYSECLQWLQAEYLR